MQKKIVHSIMAGAYIALGGMTYLLIPDAIIGAMFFSLGIFLVIHFSNRLFTRVVPLSTGSGEYGISDCVIAWLGNAVGAFAVAGFAHFSRLEEKLAERVESVAAAKLEDTPLSLFIMGVFCAIFVSYAVFSMKKKLQPGIQIFMVWILITAFVYGGYDHIVANFYYLSAYGWAGGRLELIQVAKVLAFVTAGNVAGGLLCGLFERRYILRPEKN